MLCCCALQAEKCFDSFAYYQSVMDFAGYHSINPDISKVRQRGERACTALASHAACAQMLRVVPGCMFFCTKMGIALVVCKQHVHSDKI
jgi:hypothetical protein